jgi:hypothetical protein
VTHLPDYAEYADEKYHEEPQSARGDHWGNIEDDHAGMQCHQKTKPKAKAWNPHPIVENNTDSKEK